MNNVSQVIDDLENKRRKIYNTIPKVLGSFFALMILMGIIVVSSVDQFDAGPAPIMFVMLVLMVVWFCYAASSLKKKANITSDFKKIYKNTFVVNVLKDNFDNVVYHPLEGYDKTSVKNMGLVTLGDRFSSEDLLQGSYKGVNFSQSDVVVEEEHESDDGTTVITLFKGRMFTFVFPKKDVVGVKVFSNNFMNKDKRINGNKYEKVAFEDVEFNKKFKVYAANEHDAFYVLTPNMMENIKKIFSVYGNVSLHIADGILYLGFNTYRDTFDADYRKPLSYPTEKTRIEGDVQVIKDIIDTLHIA